MRTVTASLANAGVDLAGGSIAWGRRPEHTPAIEITARDREILATVLDLGYLTTSMFAALFWGRATPAAHLRLKRLHDVGYLDKLRPRVKAGAASREWIYRLSHRGWTDIVAHDPRWAGHSFRESQLTSISYVEHDVQVNALLVHVAQQAVDDRVGGILERLPFDIVGPRSGAVTTRSTTESLGPSASPMRAEHALPGRLEPDATLLGVDRSERHTAVMIEYDRTRLAHRQIDKLRRYDHFLTGGWRETRYATLDIEPVVLFICTSSRQLSAFLRTADRHLTAWQGSPTSFRNASEHTGREQIAFTTRERLLRSDWSVDQVSPKPAASLHALARICRHELALPQLFRTHR